MAFRFCQNDFKYPWPWKIYVRLQVNDRLFFCELIRKNCLGLESFVVEIRAIYQFVSVLDSKSAVCVRFCLDCAS